MINVYNLSIMDEIANEMIAHMKGQIENPALLNSGFVFDEVLYIDVNFPSQSPITRLVGSQEGDNKSKEQRSRMLQMGHNHCFKMGRDQ